MKAVWGKPLKKTSDSYDTAHEEIVDKINELVEYANEITLWALNYGELKPEKPKTEDADKPINGSE